jgi:hypothetical protein
MSLLAALAVAAALPHGGEPTRLDPAQYRARIDHPYLPLRVGSRWVYREIEAGEPDTRIVVTVTRRTRVVDGVRARVVRDVARRRGRVTEATDDYYAQHRDGSVWYLGEDTAAYEPGEPPSKAGSWEAGVDGAQAGVAMPAHPRAGQHYRQEYAKGEAEDRARVLSRREMAEVPFGRFRRALLIRETTPLEPDALEYKLYARGVGQVLTLEASGGASREELVSYHRG